MKKVLFLAFISFTSYTFTFAQIGLGLGSSGFNLKTSPDKGLGLIVRTNFRIGNDVVFIPEINGIKRFVNEDKAKLYMGVGLGSYILADRSFDQFNTIYLKVPVGIEYFPFESKRFSLTAETGLGFFFSEAETSLNFLSLLELTFYLQK
jgi:hypothetical protein